MILEIIILAAAVLIFLVLVFVGWIIGTYNSLQNGRQNVKTQFSNIKTEYQRRADLFYNLVQSVKGHAKFEKSTLTEVTRNRNPNIFGGTPKQQIAKMKELDSFFSRLLVTVEAYPKLQSIEQYNKLVDEIRITEDRINVARTDFNGVVREYNLIIVSFPTSQVARAFGFKEENFFENEKSTDNAPKIDMSLD
jgi:LemA protein